MGTNLSTITSIAPGALVVVAAYFVGSVPFGFLVARFVKGIDIRRHGSGNIGATNVGRVLGARWGIAVLVLDILKGALPVGVLAPAMLGGAPDILHWQVFCGVATVLGHMFPCWLKFNAGKGVATALGVIICLGGWSTALAAGVFIITLGLWRYASLSAMLATTAFGASQIARLWPRQFSAENWSLTAFSLFVPLLIIARHRKNVARLFRGTEPKYRFSKSAEEVPPAAAETKVAAG